MLAHYLESIKVLDNPFRKYDYESIVKKNFWNNKCFLDDLSENKMVCGDANILPFWSGLLRDKALLRKAVDSIRKEGLDKPFPLKYASRKFKEQKMIDGELLAGDYERDVIWAHIGLMYIRVVADLDKNLARKYLEQYKKQIETYHTFIEVYDKDGKPFKTLLYYADEGMLWAANYLYLKKILS
jgi:hypothetical protein